MRNKNKRHNIFFLVVWNVILLVLIIAFQSKASGQYYKPASKLTFLTKNWSVGINGGRTSFFGDVSLYDDELSAKEGSWGYGFTLSKQMSPVFGLDGQILFGTLEGENSGSQFKSKITEYSVNLTLNLVNLLIPNNDAHLFFYAKGGLGQFYFNSTLSHDDPELEDRIVKTDSPEVAGLIGGGAYYMINSSFDVNMEMLARIIDNDKLDGKSNKKDKDYYSYLSIGVVYKINNSGHDTRFYRRNGMRSSLIRRR